MKKIIIILLLFVTQASYSQNVFPTDVNGGNVGIGTTNPLNGLHLFKLNDFNGGSIRFGHSGSYDALLSFGWNNSTSSDAFKLSYNSHNSASDVVDLLTIGVNGLVGIGTPNPISKLSIVGSLTIESGLINTYLRPLVSAGTLLNGEIRGYSKSSDLADDGFLRISAGGGTNSTSKSFIDLSGYSTIPDMNRNIVFGTLGTERMRIDLNGNIGIGTTVPDSKLAVNGTIHSKEVQVDISGWPDFVFKKEYTLRTLEEVEKHIIEKGHLENIPSEEEVLKNGINLGEMNAKLLQKIEELTLYMIEMKKENTELKNRQQQFEKVILRLTNKM